MNEAIPGRRCTGVPGSLQDGHAAVQEASGTVTDVPAGSSVSPVPGVGRSVASLSLDSTTSPSRWPASSKKMKKIASRRPIKRRNSDLRETAFHSITSGDWPDTGRRWR